MTPVVATTRDELDAALKTFRPGPEPIGLVPTMGALHAGNMPLMLRETRARSRATVVSNSSTHCSSGRWRTYGRYPRDLAADLDVCSAEGVAVVFVPDTYGRLSRRRAGGERSTPARSVGELEGASRPGHFSGVLTVVAKLFGLVRPDFAVFGEKDYQQLALVRSMVRGPRHGRRRGGDPHGARARRPGSLVPQPVSERRGARDGPGPCRVRCGLGPPRHRTAPKPCVLPRLPSSVRPTALSLTTWR